MNKKQTTSDVIPIKGVDSILNIISILGLVVLIVLPLIYYGDLPNRIPIHFGPNGQADGWGSKSSIWTLPVLGFLLFGLLNYLIKFPFALNTVKKKNPIQSLSDYAKELRIVRVLNALLTSSFAYITFSSIQTALGHKAGLSTWFMSSFVFVIFCIVCYAFFFSKKESS